MRLSSGHTPCTCVHGPSYICASLHIHTLHTHTLTEVEYTFDLLWLLAATATGRTLIQAGLLCPAQARPPECAIIPSSSGTATRVCNLPVQFRHGHPSVQSSHTAQAWPPECAIIPYSSGTATRSVQSSLLSYTPSNERCPACEFSQDLA